MSSNELPHKYTRSYNSGLTVCNEQEVNSKHILGHLGYKILLVDHIG